ncbi:MAG TPA: DUF447 domain-containing protein [Paraburkholderia sp.]
MIHETIVTTAAPDGQPHVAPMGVRREGEHVILAPFKPSTTLDNIVATRAAVVNYTTDVRIFAGCVTRTKADWPTVRATRVASVRLAAPLAHDELELEAISDDPQRPQLTMRRVHHETHAPFAGFNRAQSAVVEGAILVSRLFMLSAEKIDAEMAYLQIAIDKTAGDAERVAWDWLVAAIARHRATANAGTLHSTSGESR